MIWRQPILILLVFLVGGAATFAYSYAPLHRADRWRIEYLEERLANRTEQAKQLEADLASARDAVEDAPAAEALAALEARVEEATKLADSRKREISDLEQKLSRTERSLHTERTARESAEARLEIAERSPAPAPATAPDAHATSDGVPSAPPAAPAAGARDDLAPGTALDDPDSTG